MPQLKLTYTIQITPELNIYSSADPNHEVWMKCDCGNEEDLKMTWICSECGAVLFEPSKKKKSNIYYKL